MQLYYKQSIPAVLEPNVRKVFKIYAEKYGHNWKRDTFMTSHIDYAPKIIGQYCQGSKILKY